MSQIRIDATLFFTDDRQGAELARQFMALARTHESKLANTNQTDVERVEVSRIEQHRCFHDEKEPRPCRSMDLFEKGAPVRR